MRFAFTLLPYRSLLQQLQLCFWFICRPIIAVLASTTTYMKTQGYAVDKALQRHAAWE